MIALPVFTVETFEASAKAFAKLARSPEWQKLKSGPRDKALAQQKQIALALKKQDPDRLAKIVLALPSSYPRTELLEVIADIAKPQLAKLTEVKNLGRLDYYTAFEALLAQPAKYKAFLKTATDRTRIDIACDVLVQKTRSMKPWWPSLFPHVVRVDGVCIEVEREPKVYAQYLAWALTHVDHKVLAKLLRRRLPEFYDRSWIAQVKPALAAVAKKLDNAKLAGEISNLDL